ACHRGSETIRALVRRARREISQGHEISRRAVARGSTQQFRSAVSAQSERLHSRCERGGCGPQELRRGTLTSDLPVGGVAAAPKVLPRQPGEVPGGEHARGLRQRRAALPAEGGRERALEVQLPFTGGDHRALDDVLQLANVPWPGVPPEGGGCL